ncbi:BlaI/MecI/CopY family transcriptional regulator [uncultured Microscilla sp.]|uniref:BlaI/MecI/CopY family transcriptional regulator n=1 Tax=uncultured Microscilla sp. TaxID=432653 RepID=UPI002625B79C|nr:BlaI/MecI/CopY family transcriptional regulator [uncultured Microscilla sp.]
MKKNAKNKGQKGKQLTKAEEQVMKVLWKLEKAFIKEIIADIPVAPGKKKPAYSTVSTIVRLLEEKGFVTHQTFGNTYRYEPLVKKEEYTSFWLDRFMTDYFGGSFARLASFFAKDKNVDISDIEDILEDIDKNLKQKNDDERKK